MAFELPIDAEVINSSSYISHGISLRKNTSSFSLYYSITGSGSVDFFVHTSPDGINFVKQGNKSVKGASGEGMVHLPIIPCDAFKIEAEETLGAAMTVTAKVNLLPGNFGIKPYFDDEIIVPASVTEDIFHYAIHEGLGQEISHHVDVANHEYMNISFTTPARGTSIHMLTEFDCESQAQFIIRRDCTITASGTAGTPSNRNQYLATPPTSGVIGGVSPHTTAGQVTVDAVLDDAGTIVNGGGAGHNVGTGKFAGGSAQANHEYVLKPASLHMFEFHNLTTSANEMYFNLTWFEVPDA